MRRKFPSTAALAVFEAAARHESFTKAADELSVTQSAVCRQIANLESFLGLNLFRRTRRGVILTEAGSNYSRQVRARLDEVERDTIEVMAKRGGGGNLELGVVPTFATKWLLPRLACVPARASRHQREPGGAASPVPVRRQSRSMRRCTPGSRPGPAPRAIS